VLHLDRQHPGGDFDAVDLPRRHGHAREHVGFVWQLRGPQPGEALVTNLA
jgi:hypothetical protein